MTPRTPTTDDERIVVEALKGVRMLPASWEKRFRNQLSPDQLSEKERPQVWRLFKKYRRQIHGQTVTGVEMRGAPWQNLLALADKLAAPDFRALNAKHEIQQRIGETKARLAKAKQEAAEHEAASRHAPAIVVRCGQPLELWAGQT